VKKIQDNKPATCVKKVRREVIIRGTVYRLTSSFEGLKDLDTTVKRLAVKHATSHQTQN
jgi:hypothetical protein